MCQQNDWEKSGIMNEINSKDRIDETKGNDSPRFGLKYCGWENVDMAR